jgi:hypothetical protein
LRHSAPADVTDQDGLVLRGGGAVFRLDHAQSLDGGDVEPELLLLGTFPDPVTVVRPIVPAVEKGDQVYSGGRRMYFSRTSSQARSCAC